MLSKINNGPRQIYSFEYFSYPCWCRSWFLFFFFCRKEDVHLGHTPQALILLRTKKYIHAEKLCRCVFVTKKGNQMVNPWICPHWFLRQGQWQLLQFLHFCTAPKVFVLV